MKYVRRLSLWVLPLLVLAYDRADTPAGPEISDLPVASSIVDGSSPEGLDGLYFRPAGSFCGGSGPDAHGLTNLPVIDVIADPSDTKPPVVASLQVSPDAEAPLLQSLDISVVDVTVTITMEITDDLSGVRFTTPRFNSATTTQVQRCGTGSTPISGTSTDGTFQCFFTFPEDSALGDWSLSLVLSDAAGNFRSYSRRADDGFLCYFDSTTSTRVCEDFGDTDIVVQ